MQPLGYRDPRATGTGVAAPPDQQGRGGPVGVTRAGARRASRSAPACEHLPARLSGRVPAPWGTLPLPAVRRWASPGAQRDLSSVPPKGPPAPAQIPRGSCPSCLPLSRARAVPPAPVPSTQPDPGPPCCSSGASVSPSVRRPRSAPRIEPRRAGRLRWPPGGRTRPRRQVPERTRRVPLWSRQSGAAREHTRQGPPGPTATPCRGRGAPCAVPAGRWESTRALCPQGPGGQSCGASCTACAPSFPGPGPRGPADARRCP